MQSFSQIGAEAQGGLLGFWSALGIDQSIGTKWVSVTDIGYGRHSNPDDLSVMKKLGLNVITQDFVYKRNEHWEYFFSFGYWRRYSYHDNQPYTLKDMPYQFRNELRPFLKIKYKYYFKHFSGEHMLRTDYRFYFTQNFSDSWTTPFEFRLRFLESIKIPLDNDQKNYLIVVDEVLSACDKQNLSSSIADNWTAYQITENRLSVYFKRTLIRDKIDLDLGLMHQYWREKPGVQQFNTTWNLMLDLIIKDPFGEEKKQSN